jgi:hypothetical protein
MHKPAATAPLPLGMNDSMPLVNASAIHMISVAAVL